MFSLRHYKTDAIISPQIIKPQDKCYQPKHTPHIRLFRILINKNSLQGVKYQWKLTTSGLLHNIRVSLTTSPAATVHHNKTRPSKRSVSFLEFVNHGKLTFTSCWCFIGPRDAIR